MAGPWEQYAQPEPAGPWTNYGGSPSAQPSPSPDMGPWNAYVKKNLADANAAQSDQTKTSQAAPELPGPQPHPAQGLLDALEAGWQTSVTGLLANRKLPDTVLPENAGMAMRIAQGAGQFAGDVPAMIAGGAMGGAAGTEVPVVGNAAGMAAGAWAMPAAMRRYYIDRLQKGEVTSFGDLFERMAGSLWDGVKAGTVGLATEGAGGIASEAIGQAAPIATQAAAKFAAQLGTMTTVGAAMNGQVPKAQDFVEGALLMAGLHGVANVSSLPEHVDNLKGKLQEIYAQTGVKPTEILMQATADPVLKQELLSKENGIPKTLQEHIEAPQPNQDILAPRGPDMMTADVPAEFSESNPTLNPKGFNGSADEVQIAKNDILDRVGKEPPKENQTFKNLYTRALDDLNPVQELTDALRGDKKLPAGSDPVKLMREARAYGGMAEVAIDKGPRDFATLEPTGTPGLKQIFAPFKGDLEGFKAYAIASRAIELEGRGVETGIPLDQAKTYVEANQGKYDEGFRKLVDFQNDHLKYLRDAGVVSEDLYNQSLEQNKNYVPFNRMQEGGAGGRKSAAAPIKKIFGSDLQLTDPFEQIIKNTFSYLKIAEQNRAKLELTKLAEKSADKGEGLIERVPPKMAPIEVKPEELARYLTEHGIHEGDPEAMTIFRPLAQHLADDQFAVMRDGKREVYSVDPSVAKALNATDYQAPNIIMKVAQFPTKILRTGAVETIDFLMRHGIRDTVNATVLSSNGYRPFIDSFLGLKEYFKGKYGDGSKAYDDWLSAGGGMASFASLDKDYLQSKIFELSRDTGLLDKAKNVLKNPLQITQAMAELVTSAPRLAEFMNAREAGKGLKESAYDSRQVTIDNQRMGSDPAIRSLSLLKAFWNTRIQGVDRLVQAVKENPASTLTKMSLAVTLPSVLLWAYNHDDPRVKDTPRWEKDLFWLIPTKDTVYRIPKPFEQGILFGSLAERMLDEFYAHKPEAFKSFFRTVTEGAVPNPMPDALSAPIEQFANKSFLTGGNIVPHSLEGVAPEYQYNNYTSETAKVLGKMISYVPGVRDVGSKNVTLASPMVVQNYVRAWSGGLGMYALQASDKALETLGIASPPPKPASSLADIPVIKAFVVRYPSANSQSIQDFYDNFEKNQTVHNTIAHLAKTGDFKALSSYQNTPEAKENAVNLMGMEKALSAQNKLIQNILANPQMRPDEKRQTIDGVYYQMIQIAQQGNQLMTGMKKKSEGM